MAGSGGFTQNPGLCGPEGRKVFGALIMLAVDGPSTGTKGCRLRPRERGRSQVMQEAH